MSEKENIAYIFGKAVQAYREHLGMSQVQLAEKVGLKRASISNIEAGRSNSSFPMIVKLANALKVKPYKLFLKTSYVVKVKTQW